MGGGPKGGGGGDKRITTCKRCGTGIYKGEEVLWQRTPVVGLIHLACATAPDPRD